MRRVVSAWADTTTVSPSAPPDTYPLELPTPIITVPVGEVRLTAPSGPWLVKVARVEAPGTDSYAPSRTF